MPEAREAAPLRIHLVSSLLPYYDGQGDITSKPDITRFDGNTVHFMDLSSVEVDVIVFATGCLVRCLESTILSGFRSSTTAI